MTEMDNYYKLIDDRNFEALTESEITARIPQLDENDSDFKKMILEHIAFDICKSFDIEENLSKHTLKGLSCKASGKNLNANGEEIDFYYPDVTSLTDTDFIYFEERYKNCKSLFPKTEYGLLIYFGQKTVYAKRTDFKQELAKALFDIAILYYNKVVAGGEDNFEILSYFRYLKTAFLVLSKAKIESDLEIIIQHIIMAHQNWDTTKKDTMRALLDLSGLMSENYSIFRKKIDFTDVISKNLAGAQEVEKTYIDGALYIVHHCIHIRQQQGIEYKDLLRYEAELYEKKVVETEDNFVKLLFIQTALRKYQSLKDSVKITELQQQYSVIRGGITMNAEGFIEFSQEYLRERKRLVDDFVSMFDEKEIMEQIAGYLWFGTIDGIKEEANKIEQNTIYSFLVGSTKVLDKFGNTVDEYITGEEKEMYFWKSFDLTFQSGIQLLHQFIFEAYKAGKFTYDSFMSYLETTWFNEPIKHIYANHEFELKIIDVLKPGIRKFFEEFYLAAQDWVNCNFDCLIIIDTLTLKMETILRFFCERVGIATFKTRDKAGTELVMEKLLDDLLNDIKDSPENKTNFNEDDRLMLKYVLTLKGQNLRNRVAHGLMDLHEYQFIYIIILLYLLVRLSQCKFETE